MKKRILPKLPSSGPAREALRKRGQFWTPPWVAEAMVSYVVADSDHVFDPAVGAGAFFQAAKKWQSAVGGKLRFLGTEIDERALKQALESGLSREDLREVQIRDFLLDPPPMRFAAIVANPPYIRHHRLSPETKSRLRQFCRSLLGFQLDGRAGYHIYFLLRALQHLEPNGRLAFIMPADTCEGVFARSLWKWITNRYRLEVAIAFAPDASPFPAVDTNALIFLIRNVPPTRTIVWGQCGREGASEIVGWVESGFKAATTNLSVYGRTLEEAIETGLSRPPSTPQRDRVTLACVASVMRGIATGANEFFFLTRKRIAELRLPYQYFVPAIGRTRDIQGDIITSKDLEKLENRGRPTRLLSLGDVPLGNLPEALQRYIEAGEKIELPKRPLIASRRPWYRMEVRPVPPFLFAYLGRRKTRFILNQAGVVPLTGFLCVYPRDESPEFLEKLWRALNHPHTLVNLRLVGKSYGAGAIKVEPRALEALPLPDEALAEAGLQDLSTQEQYVLDF